MGVWWGVAHGFSHEVDGCVNNCCGDDGENTCESDCENDCRYGSEDFQVEYYVNFSGAVFADAFEDNVIIIMYL